MTDLPLTGPRLRLLRLAAAYDGQREGLFVCGHSARCVPVLRDAGLISVEWYRYSLDRDNYRIIATDAGRRRLEGAK